MKLLIISLVSATAVTLLSGCADDYSEQTATTLPPSQIGNSRPLPAAEAGRPAPPPGGY